MKNDKKDSFESMNYIVDLHQSERFVVDIENLVTGSLRDRLEHVRTLFEEGGLKREHFTVKVGELFFFDIDDISITRAYDLSDCDDIVRYTLCNEEENELQRVLSITRHEIGMDGNGMKFFPSDVNELYNFLADNDVDTSAIISKIEKRFEEIEKKAKELLQNQTTYLNVTTRLQTFRTFIDEIVSGETRVQIDQFIVEKKNLTNSIENEENQNPPNRVDFLIIGENIVFNLEKFAIHYSRSGEFTFDNGVVFTLCKEEGDLQSNQLSITRHEYFDGEHVKFNDRDVFELFNFLESKNIETMNLLTQLKNFISPVDKSPVI